MHRTFQNLYTRVLPQVPATCHASATTTATATTTTVQNSYLRKHKHWLTVVSRLFATEVEKRNEKLKQKSKNISKQKLVRPEPWKSFKIKKPSSAATCASVTKIAAANEQSLQSKFNLNLSHVPVQEEKSTYLPIQRPFTVQLSMELEPNELVALTGSSRALGEWKLERAIPLRPFGRMQWSANVLLQQSHNISYRYFTYVLDASGNKLVRRWEADLQPRELKLYQSRQVDRFGEIEKGDIALQRGWLTNESIVQLKFEYEKMFQVKQVNKFDPKHLLIKVVPLHEDLKTVVRDREGLCVDVAKLKYAESQLQPQQSFGIEYQPGDVVIFHMTVPRPMKYGFALIFHTPQKKPIGRAIIAPKQISGSEGVLELNVLGPKESDTEALATLSLPYLFVQPLEETLMDFQTTYMQYWPKSWPVLDVGHRGMGRSYIDAEAPAERENTITSFLRAYDTNADMVELDVHLTMDGVPIIWHDFTVKTAPKGKEITKPSDLEVVLIKDFSYAALKELRVFAVINETVKEFPSHNDEPVIQHRIFPRLVDVLQALPHALGIDVEIKWPQRQACGGIEAQQSIDKNFFVDRVLQTVLQHGCGRPLIFSSFDADICTMLRFKQNMLPVMFLTMGETTKWKPFMDLRTRSFQQAVNFAQAIELVGTAPHAEDFVGEDGSKLMQLAHNLNQITLLWGNDCNSPERIKCFSAMGASAVCYDRMDLNLLTEKKTSFFNTIRSQELFQGQCKQ